MLTTNTQHVGIALFSKYWGMQFDKDPDLT